MRKPAPHCCMQNVLHAGTAVLACKTATPAPGL